MERPQRWDRPFAPDMTPADVVRVLALPVLRDIDQGKFPKHQALWDIIKNDARLERFRRGDIIMRNGDYGNSVFVIMDGTVLVAVEDGQERRGGRRAGPGQPSFLRSLSQLWRNARMPEVRDIAAYQAAQGVGLRGEAANARTFIKDVDAFVATNKTVQLGPGQTFGEIAALSRTPRTATVIAESDVELVEIRWQGLRDIRSRDATFRDLIDRLYRERSLATHLAESPLFSHLDDETLGVIAERTLFETHGAFDWWSSYKKIEERDSGAVLQQEPIIAEQGSYLDGLVMIRSGFGRVSERLDHGERTVGFLSQNDLFGLEEITEHWRNDSELALRRSLRAIGYVDILRVPTALIEEHVLPTAPAHLLPKAGAMAAASVWEEAKEDGVLEQSLFDFLVDNRTINGTAAMLINTDRCTGCDDCVRACASTHNNNPRFIRHGPTHGNIQVTNACMHCVDPVCLIGCPTGAISRNLADGRVLIDDRTCIGCGTCANSCPYSNIQLVEIRGRNGEFIVDDASRNPIMKATKCDLCYDQLGGPACQRACPHDALVRIDMHDQKRLEEWVNR